MDREARDLGELISIEWENRTGESEGQCRVLGDSTAMGLRWSETSEQERAARGGARGRAPGAPPARQTA